MNIPEINKILKPYKMEVKEVSKEMGDMVILYRELWNTRTNQIINESEEYIDQVVSNIQTWRN